MLKRILEYSLGNQKNIRILKVTIRLSLNTDALSRFDNKVPESCSTAITTQQPSSLLAQLKEAQMKDEHIQQLQSLLAS